MGRTYKQSFVFYYYDPKIKPKITNKYKWKCIQNIELKL